MHVNKNQNSIHVYNHYQHHVISYKKYLNKWHSNQWYCHSRNYDNRHPYRKHTQYRPHGYYDQAYKDNRPTHHVFMYAPRTNFSGYQRMSYTAYNKINMSRERYEKLNKNLSKFYLYYRFRYETTENLKNHTQLNKKNKLFSLCFGFVLLQYWDRVYHLWRTDTHGFFSGKEHSQERASESSHCIFNCPQNQVLPHTSLQLSTTSSYY